MKSSITGKDLSIMVHFVHILSRIRGEQRASFQALSSLMEFLDKEIHKSL